MRAALIGSRRLSGSALPSFESECILDEFKMFRKENNIEHRIVCFAIQTSGQTTLVGKSRRSEATLGSLIFIVDLLSLLVLVMIL